MTSAVSAERIDAPSPAPSVAAKPAAKSPYIISRGADWAFFIGSPLWAWAIGYLVARPWLHDAKTQFFGQQVSIVMLLSISLTHSHLVLVFFRSHGNREVFKQFPLRFTVVPLVCFAAMVFSKWCLLFGIAVTTLWDVYHTSMQTFGLGRIYDAKRGVNPLHRRRLDMALNHLLYIGPVVAGASLLIHLNTLKRINEVGSSFFDFVPAYAELYHGWLAKGVVMAGALFLGHYVASAIGDAKRGIPISPQKIALLASTGFVSIMSWGFSSFGSAFIIVNLFHAVQYFAIVWWAERENVKKLFRVQKLPSGNVIGFLIFCALGLGYGFWFGFGYLYWSPTPRVVEIMVALTNTVATMHFWYDGFVWSVRRKAVPT